MCGYDVGSGTGVLGGASILIQPSLARTYTTIYDHTKHEAKGTIYHSVATTSVIHPKCKRSERWLRTVASHASYALCTYRLSGNSTVPTICYKFKYKLSRYRGRRITMILLAYVFRERAMVVSISNHYFE